MKKLNRSGFMLAEIIIVSAIIMTTLVGLYKGFSDTYKAYEIRNSYYDVKTIYALKNFENFLIDEMILNNITNDYIEVSKQNNLFSGDNSRDYHNRFIKTFFETYFINKLYIVKYNKLDNFKSIVDDEFKDYIEFYTKNIESTDNDYNYILITKVGKITTDDNKEKKVEEKYSALRIK